MPYIPYTYHAYHTHTMHTIHVPCIQCTYCAWVFWSKHDTLTFRHTWPMIYAHDMSGMKGLGMGVTDQEWYSHSVIRGLP